MKMVLRSIGIAANKVCMMILSCPDFETVFRGLRILKDLKIVISTTLLLEYIIRYPLMTMIKSRMFQQSLRYAFYGKINPMPNIFSKASMV